MKDLNFQLNCRLEVYNVARHGFFQRYFLMFLIRRTFSMAAPVNRILRVFGKDAIIKMQLSTYSKLELATAVQSLSRMTLVRLFSLRCIILTFLGILQKILYCILYFVFLFGLCCFLSSLYFFLSAVCICVCSLQDSVFIFS